MGVMIKEILISLFLRLIKDYSIFFVLDDTYYFVNDIVIDVEMKEIVLEYVERWNDESNE